MDRERPRNIAGIAALFGACALVGWSLWSSHQPTGEVRKIVNVAVTKSGTLLAAGTASGRVAVWKLGRDAQPVQIRSGKGVLNDLEFSPDERWLAIADRSLTLMPMDPANESIVLRDDGENYGTVRFSSAGDTILTITGSGAIEILNAKSGKASMRVCCSSIGGAVAFSQDGSFFVAAGHLPRIWETRTGSLLARLTREREFMCLGPIGFLGNNLLMGSQDGGIRVWDLRTRQSIGGSPRTSDWVDTIAVQERTGLVAYAGFGKALQVWNPETALHYSLAGIHPTSNVVFLSPDGPLIGGLVDGRIVFWDIQHGGPQATLHFPQNN